MIQATPFDLTLLTAATNEPIQDREIHYEQVLILFTRLRDLFLNTNRRLEENPSLADLGLRIPLTESLFWQLCDTPPWSQVNRSSRLYSLKRSVLALLQRTDFILELDDMEVENGQIYSLLNTPNFLPRSLAAELCDNWLKAAGACGFASGIAEPEICLEPIHAAWIVSASPEHNRRSQQLKIARTTTSDGDAEECTLPLLTQVDQWAWEGMVRASLWQDIRLPFNGPSGPFGYRPLPSWEPNQRPKSTRIQGNSGYKDALGGLWQWEGGRATTTSPFDGHWNVQLLKGQAKRNWKRWLEEVHQQPVQSLGNHINVEPDGRIVDRTFDFG